MTTMLPVQTTDLVDIYSLLFLNPSLAIFCEGAFHTDMVIKISPLNKNFNWDTIDTAVSPPCSKRKYCPQPLEILFKASFASPTIHKTSLSSLMIFLPSSRQQILGFLMERLLEHDHKGLRGVRLSCGVFGDLNASNYR